MQIKIQIHGNNVSVKGNGETVREAVIDVVSTMSRNREGHRAWLAEADRLLTEVIVAEGLTDIFCLRCHREAAHCNCALGEKDS